MDTEQASAPAAFVSYAHEDRAIANELAFGLQRRGCQVWIDHGELKVGDSLLERLAEGLTEVDFVLAIVSEHSVDSPWCAKELSLAMTQEVDTRGGSRSRRVLPLRVGQVDMPLSLRDKVYLEVDRERPGDLVPRLWEDIAGHASPKASTPMPTEESDAERSYGLGVSLYSKGELASARRHLHDASQESHHGAALLLGEILYDEGQAAKAAEEWQFAAGSDDTNVANAAVVNYGKALAGQEFASGRRVGGPRGASFGGRSLPDAGALWNRAAESGHRDATWAWIGLGLLREDPVDRDARPDYEGAEEAYDQASRCGHSESRTYALFKLGLTRWRLKKLDEAIAVLNVGATTGEGEWQARCAFNLGRLYWERHEDEEAGRWWYEAARSGDPGIAELAQEAIDDPHSIWRSR